MTKKPRVVMHLEIQYSANVNLLIVQGVSFSMFIGIPVIRARGRRVRDRFTHPR